MHTVLELLAVVPSFSPPFEHAKAPTRRLRARLHTGHPLALHITCVLPFFSCLPAFAAEWGIKLISSRDGVGEDGWQLRRLEPEDRQHLTVLQLAGAHGTGLARFTMRGLFHAAHDSTQQGTFSS
jgi:hypothetical protein